MKSRWSNDISQWCIMKSGNLSWIIQALIHALVPFPWPPFCSIGPRVSAWIFSPFNHLPLPFPLFVSISTLKRLLLTCYRMRQLSVCCRALSLSGDKMVIKTKSDTSNASLLLSFSAYCFFFPKHGFIFFFSTNDHLKENKDAHMVQQIFPISSGMISKKDVTHHHIQAYGSSLQKLLIFRGRVFSATKVSISAVSVDWTCQYPEALWGCRAMLILFGPTSLLGLQQLCITRWAWFQVHLPLLPLPPSLWWSKPEKELLH